MPQLSPLSAPSTAADLPRILALSRLPEGHRAVVARIRAERDLAQKLADLGLRTGCEIRVIKGSDGGPLVVGLGDGRVGLGPEMAQAILVSPLRTP
ncbi:hypothetical protein F11_12680 [Rhodospirillum rubrum F11]|uniref:FeoA n=2 Tax=Rhodospirillum rubrum TaxID=1085 RepID=Q2RRH7_RHORT|nr:FeoA family protein [Rhodospirillum rubrum]ABC23268.1 FeoA [Rhodospirillum rubrum ATCC 11170]AEO49000.1 hypothetical protein F11_12680 [Rhodospirillum rubrum F11]MBK5954938.1 ferrous iron transport protein A [Rhodospirillum rubrum]QXG79243.1 ferrous iron transport protein A [Rhodospirillum rubrum]HCF17778.1 ferrous iron transport protein A [Rhodospirillum rubrum]